MKEKIVHTIVEEKTGGFLFLIAGTAFILLFALGLLWVMQNNVSNEINVYWQVGIIVCAVIYATKTFTEVGLFEPIINKIVEHKIAKVKK